MRLIDADALKENAHTLDEWGNCVFVDTIDDAPTIKTKSVKYFDEDEKVWKIGEVIVDEQNR